MGLTVGEISALLQLDSSHFKRGLGDAENDAEKMGGGFGKVATTMAKAGMIAFAAVGTAAAGAIGFGVKIASDMQQSEIAFTTLMGSADKAKAHIKELTDFATKTPFELPSLINASRQFQNMGFTAQTVIPILTSVGDVAAATGMGAEGMEKITRALTQMGAKGKVSAEEMMQLAEAGVPAWETLASAIGKTIPETMKLAEQGKITGQTMIDAFTNMSGPLGKFRGMMAAQSQTLLGLWSTLKDTASQALAAIAQPVVLGLTQALPGLTATLQGFMTAIGPQFAGLIGNMLKMIEGLLPVIQPVITLLAGTFASALEALMPLFAALAPSITYVAGALGNALTKAIEAISPYLPQIADLFGEIVEAAVELLPELMQLGAAFLPLIPPVLELARALAFAILPAIQPLIPAFTSLVTALVGTEGNAGPLVKIMEALAAVIEKIPTEALTAGLGFLAFKSVAGGAIGTISNTAKAIADFGPAFKAGLAHGPAMMAGLDGVAGKAGRLGGAMNLLKTAGTTAISGIGSVFSTLGPMIASPVGIAVIAIMALVAVGFLIVKHWDTIKDFLGKIWDAISNAVGVAVDAVVGFFKELPGKVMGFLAELPGKLAEWAGFLIGTFIRLGISLVTWAIEAIPKLLATIGQFLVTLPGKVWEWIKEVGPKMAAAVGGMITSAVTGLGNLIARFGSFLADLPGKVWGWLKDLPGKVADAVTGMARKARELIGDVVDVFSNVGEKILKSIASLPGKLWDMAKEIGKKFVEGIKKGLGIGSPSIPERWFTAMSENIWADTKSVGKAMDALRGTMGRMPAGPSIGFGTPALAGAGGVGQMAAPMIGEMHNHMTVARPDDIATGISDEIAWTQTRVGR